MRGFFGKWIIGSAAFLCLIGFAPSAYGVSEGDHFTKDLNLPKQVREQMWESHLQYEREIIRLVAELRIAFLDRMQLEKEEMFDEQGLRKVIDRISDLRRDMEYALLRMQSRAYELLSKEQYRMWWQATGRKEHFEQNIQDNSGPLQKAFEDMRQLHQFIKSPEVNELMENVKQLMDDWAKELDLEGAMEEK